VPTGFHPHAHPHPLCRKITVELLRCLTVLRRQRRPLPVRRPARKANLF
jgi:hypothetical protein